MIEWGVLLCVLQNEELLTNTLKTLRDLYTGLRQKGEPPSPNVRCVMLGRDHGMWVEPHGVQEAEFSAYYLLNFMVDKSERQRVTIVSVMWSSGCACAERCSTHTPRAVCRH